MSTDLSDEKNNKCPIYSISVHPDGTRLATGGLGMLTCLRRYFQLTQ